MCTERCGTPDGQHLQCCSGRAGSPTDRGRWRVFTPRARNTPHAARPASRTQRTTPQKQSGDCRSCTATSLPVLPSAPPPPSKSDLTERSASCRSAAAPFLPTSSSTNMSAGTKHLTVIENTASQAYSALGSTYGAAKDKALDLSPGFMAKVVANIEGIFQPVMNLTQRGASTALLYADSTVRDRSCAAVSGACAQLSGFGRLRSHARASLVGGRRLLRQVGRMTVCWCLRGALVTPFVARPRQRVSGAPIRTPSQLHTLNGASARADGSEPRCEQLTTQRGLRRSAHRALPRAQSDSPCGGCRFASGA